MNTSINTTDVLKQLKRDLIGKDSYRGVTLTYSWLANQFGHFSLGYIPTLIMYSFIKDCPINKPALWSAITISSLWLAFECYNFLGPLLLNKRSKSKVLFVPDSKYIFPPPWTNIAFDTFTDLLFFWYGSFWASLAVHRYTETIPVLICLSVALVYPCIYWFVSKMYIQFARLPWQLRLSQWETEGDLQDNERMTVLDYVRAASTSLGYHLLIFGGRRSGKSTLGVGMATEIAQNKHSASYYTVTKLISLLSLTDRQIVDSEKCEKWAWRNASLLIVDDINFGNPVPINVISPSSLLQLIDTKIADDPSVNNRKDLANKNVIWILGDAGPVGDRDKWVFLLATIGVPGSKVSTIDLSYHYM